MTEGSYAYAEHSITRSCEILCCMPETNVIPCVNCTFLKKKKTRNKNK